MQPYLEWCDPGELTRKTVASLAREGREIRVTVPADLPFVFLDASFVERALGILLANAFLNSAPADPVELTVQREGGALVWSVLDRGPGLAAGEEIRVFEKFHRGAVRPAGGLGLGLFIARKLAELLGGTLTASRRPEGGACLVLSLPVGKPPLLPAEAALPA